MEELLEKGELIKEIVNQSCGYWISDRGNFYCNNLCNRQPNPRKLKTRVRKYGYEEASFWVDGKKKHKSVHRLVAEYFLESWDPQLTVDHIDENKTNNYISNLRMLTAEDNVKSYNTNNPEKKELQMKNLRKLANIKNKENYIKRFDIIKDSLIRNDGNVIKVIKDTSCSQTSIYRIKNKLKI